MGDLTYTTTKVDYGDETFCHNMSLFHHWIHMVTKQHSSPKLHHRICWRRKCFVTNIKMIGDEIFLSPNIFATKPYFQWWNISSPIFFFPISIDYDTARDQWIKCFDFGELRMVAEGLQNKYQFRRKVGVNRPNTLRWLS